MALASRQGAGHAPVEGFDRGIKNAARRIEMVRAQRIRVTRQSRTRKGKAVPDRRLPEGRWHLMRLQRLVVAIPTGRSIISPPIRRVSPGVPKH